MNSLEKLGRPVNRFLQQIAESRFPDLKQPDGHSAFLLLQAGKREKAEAAIAKVLREKNWYALRNKKEFLFYDSIIKLMLLLGLPINPELLKSVKEAITNSFSKESLVRVTTSSGDLSLLEAICAIPNTTIYIWTEGNKEFQEIKLERTGAANIVENAKGKIHIAKDKVLALVEILSAVFDDEATILFGADDKLKNIRDLKKNLSDGIENLGQICCVQIQSPRTNGEEKTHSPQAFYDLVLESRNANADAKIVVVLDFDGVVCDTDGALQGEGTMRLLNLLNVGAAKVE